MIIVSSFPLPWTPRPRCGRPKPENCFPLSVSFMEARCRRRIGLTCSFPGFHEQRINQLAVMPDTQDYILASASEDGSTIIWNLAAAGNAGAGVLCDLDPEMPEVSSVESLTFGRGPSRDILFTGISTDDIRNPGMVR